jgi:hypothetical protein
MAQDLFVLPLDGAAHCTYDRAVVIDILNRGSCDPVTNFYLAYRDGSGGEANGIDEDPGQTRLDHLGFVHFGGPMMMERIFEIAQALDVVLVWTDTYGDEPCACVARADYLDRLAPQYADLGSVAVARDASHLNLLVKGIPFETSDRK